MKRDYETPEMEVFSFEVKDRVMNTPCSTGYNGPVCPVDGDGGTDFSNF